MRRSTLSIFASVSITALAALTACSSAPTADGSESTRNAQTVADGAPSYAGTYATLNRVVATAQVFGIKIRSVTSSYGIAKVTASGDAYAIEERGCSAAFKSDLGPKLSVDDSTIQANPSHTATLRVVTNGDVTTYERGQSILVAGAKLSDPTEPLPTSADDPRVIDTENDGKPGMTAHVSGIPSGDIYFVQRMRSRSAGTVDSSGVFHGKVEASTDQEILRATNPFLNAPLETTPQPNDPANEARFVPVAEGFDCAALAAQKATLFGN